MTSSRAPAYLPSMEASSSDAGASSIKITRTDLTCVHNPPGATVDIVLVHGLNGHPEETWTTTNELTKKNVFWPRDLLPVTLGQTKARVLVYGYNADVIAKFGKSASSDMIHVHAQTMLASLDSERTSEGKERNAIIWVAHSLGGILVKRALNYSNDLGSRSTDPIRNIYVLTYGIIFLGTPHLGADAAKWALVLKKLVAIIPSALVDSEAQLLKTLERNNETLQEIDLHFLDVYPQRFEIDMVHEEVKYTKAGLSDYIVDRESACPRLPGVRYYGIYANHVEMCRFESRDSPGYRRVATHLHTWVKECGPKIQQRWTNEQQTRAAERTNAANEMLMIYGSENTAFQGINPPYGNSTTTETGLASGSNTAQKYPKSTRWYRLINGEGGIRRAIQADALDSITVATPADKQNQLWGFDEAQCDPVKGQTYFINSCNHWWLKFCINLWDCSKVFIPTDVGHEHEARWYFQPTSRSKRKGWLKNELFPNWYLGYDEFGAVVMKEDIGTIWILEEAEGRRNAANEMNGSKNAALDGSDRPAADGYPPRPAVTQTQSDFVSSSGNNVMAINYGNTNEVSYNLNTSNPNPGWAPTMQPAPLRPASVPATPAHAGTLINNNFSPQIVFGSQHGTFEAYREPQTSSVWEPDRGNSGRLPPSELPMGGFSSSGSTLGLPVPIGVSYEVSRSSGRSTPDGREKGKFWGLFRRGERRE